MSIYSEIILDHYKHPHNFGELPDADLQAQAINTVCGDKIKMSIKLEKNKVLEIKFEGTGCAISMAASSMLTDYAKGKTQPQLQKLSRKDILKMLSIELTPSRLKCALLPLEALQKALG